MNRESPLLEVKNLKKYFKTPGGMLHAVDDINFTVYPKKTLGIVGESGCGKSTLGRVVLGLLDATDGDVIFDGQDVTHLKGKKWKNLRRDMQIIFQDPMASWDPRFTVAQCIAEPLKIFRVCKSKEELNKRIAELMSIVGLADRLVDSFPHELDGGRRQRVGIAKALALNPKFIVCDEPVSALDVSIQAQILNLLQDLQKEFGFVYLFITHDMSVVKHISDDILVMYLGCMVEKADSHELFAEPMHPYTKGLLASVPEPDIYNREIVTMSGELSSPISPKPGCRFAERCPYAKDNCHREQPPLVEVRPEHYVACHYCREINQI